MYFQRPCSKNKNKEFFSMEAEFWNFSHYIVSQVPPKSLLMYFSGCRVLSFRKLHFFSQKEWAKGKASHISHCSHFWSTSDLFVHSCLNSLLPPSSYSKKHRAGQVRAKLSSPVNGKVPLWNSRNLLWMSIHNRFLWLKYCSQTVLAFRKTQIGISQSN